MSWVEEHHDCNCKDHLTDEDWVNWIWNWTCLVFILCVLAAMFG